MSSFVIYPSLFLFLFLGCSSLKDRELEEALSYNIEHDRGIASASLFQATEASEAKEKPSIKNTEQIINQKRTASVKKKGLDETKNSWAKRQYKYITRDDIERQSKVDEGAGSLWVMNGQSPYLFSENQILFHGDPVYIEMVGGPKSEIFLKAKKIHSLLRKRYIKRIKEKNKKERERQMLSSILSKLQPSEERMPANEEKTEPEENSFVEKKGGLKEEKWGFAPFSMEVPLLFGKVEQRLPSGSYRIKGQGSFTVELKQGDIMVDSNEYQLFGMGEIRPDDLKENKVKADKILDGQFYIAGSK